jgi:arylsulfatase A-like enzyme
MDDKLVRRDASSPALPLQAALAVALAAGAAELIIAIARKLVFGDILRVSRQAVWMAPLGEVMLVLPVVGLLYLLGSRWPVLRSLRSVLFAALVVTLTSVLLFANFLHDAAVALFAVGVAWRLAQAASARPRLVARAVFPALATLTGTFVLVGILVNARIALGERQALAALPSARAGSANVILIIWDTVRARSLSLHGGRARTPNLERLARSGVVFDRAISTAPWTLPAHASMFTGLLPHDLSVGWTAPLDGARPTLAEYLAGRGYSTAAFAANTLYVQWETGLDRGFSRFEDYRITPGQILISTALGRRMVHGRHGWETGMPVRLIGYRDFVGRKRADDVNEAALRWIDGTRDRPWFAFLNYFDAHLPFMPPAPFAGGLGVQRARHGLIARIRHEWERNGYWDMPPDELTGELAAYEESIEYLDDRLGLLLDELDARGLLSTTLIILTSDHGEEFGEHGHFEHGSNLYMEQLHVPLVISYPGHVPPGVRVEVPVSVRDIPATVAELLGHVTHKFQGISLASLWGRADASATLPIVFAELTPGLTPDVRMRAAVTARHHYIRHPSGNEELYDWTTDPGADRDLSGLPEALPITELLRSLVDSATAAPRTTR